MDPLTPGDLAKMAAGRLHPVGAPVLVFVETAWSRRRPMSYEILNNAMRPIGRIVPEDPSTDGVTLVLHAGEQAVLKLAIDGNGNATVTDAKSGELQGKLRRRIGLFSRRLRVVSSKGRRLGTVWQPSFSPDQAVIRNTEPGPAGNPNSIQRRGRGPFAGGDRSELRLTIHVRVPAPLLLAAIPALDAIRRPIHVATT
ncbi:MAG TPA: hypothetical protein VFY84_17615 [Jiangellales bacterium]|nr:hypothetical protein [Jiangellales bacterium]